MGAEPAGQLAYPLDRGVPPLADDLGRPEPASQGNSVGVTAEHDDLLRTETPGGNDAAETHRAITNDSGNLAWTYIRPQRRVMASTHHVLQTEQRCQQRFIRTGANRVQRSVGMRDAQRLRLSTIEASIAEEPAVHARRLQSFVAELATPVRVGKRHDDQIAGLDLGHGPADCLDVRFPRGSPGASLLLSWRADSRAHAVG
jgi:hypothetical protein